MPPADPIDWAVLQHLQTSLRAINGGGTYHYVVKASSVWLEPHASLANFNVTELPLLVIERLNPTSWIYQPAMQTEYELQVAITAIVPAVSGASGWIRGVSTEALMKMAADIEVALTQDITRGQRTFDTRLTPARFGNDIGAADVALLIQPVMMNLQRTYGVPTGN